MSIYFPSELFVNFLNRIGIPVAFRLYFMFPDNILIIKQSILNQLREKES